VEEMTSTATFVFTRAMQETVMTTHVAALTSVPRAIAKAVVPRVSARLSKKGYPSNVWRDAFRRAAATAAAVIVTVTVTVVVANLVPPFHAYLNKLFGFSARCGIFLLGSAPFL